MDLDIDPAVAHALNAREPVVALESTLICHGLPRPRNLEVARAAEAIVLAEGARPATIALVDGRIRVGLDAPALERLASSDDVVKCSPRDLALVTARRAMGATTVAGTIHVGGGGRHPDHGDRRHRRRPPRLGA